MTAHDGPPRPRPTTLAQHRIVVFLAILAILAACAVYIVNLVGRRHNSSNGVGTAGVTIINLGGGGGDEVAIVGEDGVDATRKPTGMHCQRYYAGGRTSVCLRLAGIGPTFEAVIGTPAGNAARTIPLAGVPSRARVSRSGKLVAWTVFISGHSYSDPGGFSTQAGILDLRSGTVVDSLETFTAIVNGAPYSAADRNYWGITFADDDNTFYATMSSAGQRWLVRGNLFTRTVVAMRRGVECPSLSPDGTKIAFKAPTALQGRWQLAVLDLGSGRQYIIPGTEGIDDQAAWLSSETLAYGVPSASGGPTIFRVGANGTEPATPWLTGASSPVPIEVP